MDVTTVLIAIFFIFVFVPLIKWWIKYRSIASVIDQIPGPPKWPIIGTAYEFIGLPRTAFYDKVIIKRQRNFPAISRSWMLFEPVVFLGCAEYVEKILSSTKNITKGPGYDFEFRKWLGDGLVTSTGEHWQQHRKLITPTFHFSILEGFCDVFAEKCDIMVTKLEKFAKSGEVVDVLPIINLAALDIICETAMGIKMDAQEKGESKYLKAVEDLAEVALHRFFNPIYHNDFIFSFTSNSKKSKEALKVLHDFTNKVISERKTLRKQETKTDDGEDFGQKRRLAFLDLLLEESEKRPNFTDKDIQEEVDTFVFAGHDTTTMSTAWALFLLGHHQEVQEKLFEEQREIFGDSTRLPTFKDLSEMKYMERVMKESIRIYPTVSQVARRATEAFEVAGFKLPAGTIVGICIYSCSRDEKYFPDPEKFDPDRWLPENSKNRHAYAHIPFSAGPRNCVGQKFAQLEEKMMLSSVIRNFKVKSVDAREDVKGLPEVVLRPYPGIKMILEKRK